MWLKLPKNKKRYMQADAAGSNIKSQIVDKIKQSTNILVAVSANPSVDSLAAAIGLTLLLNKLDKHATAVFSGEIPPAVQFLEPAKTLENSVDGLRDFIISLDKEKADRLRYKVEDDVVRIFITPYRTTISEKDLQFSQGDFNVELIIALGVEKRDDLDKAIIAHGRILHDATVVTLNANNQQSSLGALDWHDANASSLCEMLITMSESLQKPGLIDAQISTALLTGLVAATDRFSNAHTTPRVMTLAAQMMGAGANQQLIANNIQTAAPMPLAAVSTEQPAEKVGKDGELSIKHPEKPKETVEEAPRSLKEESGQAPKEAAAVRDDELKKAEDELAQALPHIGAADAPGEPPLEELKQAIKEETLKEAKKEEAPSRKFIAEAPSEGEAMGADSALSSPQSSYHERRLEPPTLGGVFTATSEQALEDNKAAQDADRNKKILTHGDAEPAQETPAAPEEPQMTLSQPEGVSADQVQKSAVVDATLPTERTAQPEAPTLEPLEPPAPDPATPPADVHSARQAVDDAFAAQPFNPARNPRIDTAAQPFSPPQLPAEPFAPAQSPASEPQAPAPQEETKLTPQTPEAIPPMPQLPISDPSGPFPPMPPSLPDLPPPLAPPVPPSAFDTPQPPAATPPDPAQYKIPGA